MTDFCEHIKATCSQRKGKEVFQFHFLFKAFNSNGNQTRDTRTRVNNSVTKADNDERQMLIGSLSFKQMSRSF